MNSIVSEKIISENQQQVTYKVKYNEELRRFSLPSGATWETVISKIGTLFSLNVDSIVVKYEDDEKELVTIDSDAELQEAVRVFLNQSSEEESNLILRLMVFEIPQKSKINFQHQHQEQQQSDDNNKSYYCPLKKWRENYSSCGRGRGAGGSGQYNNKCQWREKREKCRAALMQMEEKGFKCKGKNIRALKCCDYDVDKAVEYLIKSNPKCEKFKTDLDKLQEMGFDNKWANCFVLKRTGGDIDKAVSILTQAKSLELKGCDNQFFAAKLLIKYDGDAEKVEEIWNKKKDAYLAKRQKCMDRKLKKCDSWKKNKKSYCPKKKWQERKCGSKWCGGEKKKCEKECCTKWCRGGEKKKCENEGC